MSLMDSIEKVESTFEKMGNICGYVPIVSSASGLCRIGAGQLQFDFGIIAAVTAIIGGAFSSGENKTACYQAAGRFGEQSLHGIANMMRGTVEAIPVINLLTIPYDMLFKRIGYPVEFENTKLEDHHEAREFARTLLPSQLLPAVPS